MNKQDGQIVIDLVIAVHCVQILFSYKLSEIDQLDVFLCVLCVLRGEPLIFSLVGLKVEAEIKTNKGRIDAVIIDKDIYIFEFKFNRNKDKALNQIKKTKYFEKYQGRRAEGGGPRSDKPIYLFGVEFTERNVGEWVVEKMDRMVLNRDP